MLEENKYKKFFRYFSYGLLSLVNILGVYVALVNILGGIDDWWRLISSDSVYYQFILITKFLSILDLILFTFSFIKIKKLKLAYLFSFLGLVVFFIWAFLQAKSIIIDPLMF
jgi:hypothetical protein